MKRFPRLSHALSYRPRPAAILAAGTAVIVLGAVGTLGATDATMADFQPKQAPTVTVTAPGDDNGDGRIDEDESGWDCATMGNRQCGPRVLPECAGEIEYADTCATVANRPGYEYTAPDGTVHTVPDGRTLLARIDAPRGTAAFEVALFELDAQYIERALHNEH